VGRALLGKRKGDTVLVHTPGGDVEYSIVAIHTRRPG
jgi:transcription elongation GreA/GreB family factor